MGALGTALPIPAGLRDAPVGGLREKGASLGKREMLGQRGDSSGTGGEGQVDLV